MVASCRTLEFIEAQKLEKKNTKMVYNVAILRKYLRRNCGIKLKPFTLHGTKIAYLLRRSACLSIIFFLRTADQYSLAGD